MNNYITIRNKYRDGCIWSAYFAYGSKKMKFTTYDKTGKPHHSINMDEKDLRFLMDNIKHALGEDENNG